MNPTHVNPREDFFSERVVEISADVVVMTTMIDVFKTATIDIMRVVLGHGASGTAALMKPYVVGFKRRGIDAIAVDLPRGVAEKEVPVFIKTSGRGHEVIGGGQSFRGRVASMAAVEADFGGLILFSYPPHRPRSEKRRVGEEGGSRWATHP